MTTKRVIDWVFTFIFAAVALSNFWIAFSAGATTAQRILGAIVGLAFTAYVVIAVRDNLKKLKSDQ